MRDACTVGLLALAAGCSGKNSPDSGSDGDAGSAHDGTLYLTTTGALVGTFPDLAPEVQCGPGWVSIHWDARGEPQEDGRLWGMVNLGFSDEAEPGTTNPRDASIWAELTDLDGVIYRSEPTGFVLTVDELWEPTSGSFEMELLALDANYQPDPSKPSATATGTYHFAHHPCPD